MYKISDDAVYVIKKVYKETNGEKPHISNKKELDELIFGLGIIGMGFSLKKDLDHEQQQLFDMIKATIEELNNHKDDFDFDDFNIRF